LKAKQKGQKAEKSKNYLVLTQQKRLTTVIATVPKEGLSSSQNKVSQDLKMLFLNAIFNDLNLDLPHLPWLNPSKCLADCQTRCLLDKICAAILNMVSMQLINTSLSTSFL